MKIVFDTLTVNIGKNVQKQKVHNGSLYREVVNKYDFFCLQVTFIRQRHADVKVFIFLLLKFYFVDLTLVLVIANDTKIPRS